MKPANKKMKRAKEERKFAILKKIGKDVKPIRLPILLASVISLISVATMLFAPKILGEIMDIINKFWISKDTSSVINFDEIIRNCVILGGIYLINGVGSYIKMKLMNNVVSRHFTCKKRIHITEKIKSLPIAYIDKTPHGEFISKMTQDVSSLGNTVHSILDLAIMGILQIVGISIMMFTINWSLALVVMVLVPFSMLIATFLSLKSEKHFDDHQKYFGEVYTHANECYTGFQTVKAYNLEKQVTFKMRGLSDKLASSAEKAWFLGDIVQPVIAFVNALGYIAICLVGANLAIKGTISVGDVVAIVLYAKQFSGPLEGIANTLSSMQRTFASSRRVYGLLEEKEMEKRTEKSKVETKGEVEFRDVSFSYTDQPLIEHLSFKVKQGQKVAIVGPTGGGKTTIINLLMNFYDIKSGQILIDGEDISKISRESLREKIGMVLQDTWLYNGPIAGNIAYGKDDATKEEIEWAADNTYCHHFIQSLPAGYDTVLSDDMTGISQGQKQLLTIARAFLAKRDILILDEATSNVDTRTELLIQKALKKLQTDKTSFVIAHRLSTIVDADMILVLKAGTVVETGKHQELLDKKGFYYDIFNSQYSMGLSLPEKTTAQDPIQP